MTYTISEIAHALGVKAEGDVTVTIDSVAEPSTATRHQLALAMKPEYAEKLGEGAARAAMLWDGADWQSMGLKAALLAPRPRFALSGLSAMMDRHLQYGEGIHPTAIVHPDAVLAEGVTVGPHSVIEARARIGANSVIGPSCYIGVDVTLGANALLHTGVRLMHDVTIGDRFIAQVGGVVGSDGFSFVTPEPSAVESVRETLGDTGAAEAQSFARIHSLGSVTIGNDVDLGANSCIDRGTVRDTQVGDGCKLDNLVHIGHNVVMGKDCLFCALVGIGGSTNIGNNVVLGGQAGVGDNLFLGDNVVASAASKVLSNVPAGRVIMGYPAMKMDTHLSIYKQLRRLTRLFADVAELKKAVSKRDPSD